ncbi:putative acetyltransferase [Hoeflea marina]|uniref:Putative acetyltransferase n=1 Tax=Hoeflea marina TaxID=274592 RepID=A0A317PF64_9HYPH|nr:N-acetyltransferase [Hoeflea marina]PWV98348.1 putative acetyltransferase [Hoeflea marina]
MTGGRMTAARTRFRESEAGDRAAIRRVEELAFGRPGEADLSEQLLASPAETLSLVALLGERVIGHVLLSRLEGPDQALALRPLAVDPKFQEMQIGTRLVGEALELARGRGWRSVFVHGHPDYYCRFGFRSRLAEGAEIDRQGPRFLALELVAGALAGWHGELDYPGPSGSPR